MTHMTCVFMQHPSPTELEIKARYLDFFTVDSQIDFSFKTYKDSF